MPLAYEINTRCWLGELSARAGHRITLANIPESEFQEWQRLGFTHIWLMGVWTSGPRSRAVALAVDDLQRAYGCSLQNVRRTDIAGSPYAIAAYQVPKALGGEAGLREFRRKLRGYEIKLLLDFVPNHVGLDHPWLKTRPELFVQSATEQPGFFAQETRAGLRWIAHGRDPNFTPWSDAAQLDYRMVETRAAMQEQLLSVADRCDGVRCDMAMLVLPDVFEATWKDFPPADRTSEHRSALQTGSEFWPDTIATTRRAQGEFLFLAEVYWGMERRLQLLGFDFTYNKELYDELIRHNPVGVRQRLLNSTPEFLSASVHFLENHDEARIASVLSLAEHRAAALLLMALPGMRLLHQGQLAGARIKVPVQLKCRAVEAEQSAIREMYEQLLSLIKNSPMGRGSFAVLPATELSPGNLTAQNIVSILWLENEREIYLVAVNLASCRSQARVVFPTKLQILPGCTVRNLLKAGQSTNVLRFDGGNSGIFLDLAAHEGQLLQVSAPGPMRGEFA